MLARPPADNPRAKSHRAVNPSTFAPSSASRALAHASASSNSTNIFISLVPGFNAPTSTTARFTTPKSPHISLACVGLVFPGKFSIDKNLVARVAFAPPSPREFARALVGSVSSSMRTTAPIGRRRSSSETSMVVDESNSDSQTSLHDDDDVDDDVDDNRWETESARMTSSPRAAVAVVIPRTN